MIEVKNLSKAYGKHQALSDVSFRIDEGQIVGLMGPSGSGKTTLMDIISGLLYYKDGEVFIEGQPPNEKTKAIVSLLTEENAIPNWMTVMEIAKFYHNMYEDFDETKLYRILDEIHIDIPLRKKISHLSKGMLQLLRLALTLSRQAKLYLLDEPLGGMDTIVREQVIEMLFEYAHPYAAILITSQIISEIEKLIERVIFIKDGQLIGDYDCEALRAERGQSIEKIYKEVMR